MSTVPESLRAYRFDLVQAIDREIEVGRRPILRRRRLGWRAAPVAVAIAAVALLALTVAQPWHGSPTILDRAQAALLAPTGGQILYESITVRRVPAGSAGSVHRVQLWLDGETHRFRMTFSGPQPAEVGGTVGSSAGLNYVGSANALYRAAFQFRVSQRDLDPAGFIRWALRSGKAQILGKTTVRGHEVICIQFSAWFMTWDARRLEPIALYYVDADTYRPVRVVTPPPYGRVGIYPDTRVVRPDNFSSWQKVRVVYPQDTNLGFPMDPSAFLTGFPGMPTRSFPVIPDATTISAPRAHLVYDFDDYRQLAPTAANRKLTSVRAVRDDIAGYASGFRTASTPLFKALDVYLRSSACGLGLVRGLAPCVGAIGHVRAAIPALLRYVAGHKPPGSSLGWTNADLRRLVVTLHGLQRGFAELAALVAADDFVNPTRYSDSVVGFYKAIAELQVDIPELRLRF